MDCVKNLTSCQGCTRKHARCHWRDVEREEVEALDFEMDAQESHASPHAPEGADGGATSVSTSAAQGGLTNGYGLHDYVGAVSDDEGARNEDSDDEDDSNPLEDLEAVGEEAVREHEAAREELRLDEEGLLRAKDLSRLAVRSMSDLNVENGTEDAGREQRVGMNGVERASGPQSGAAVIGPIEQQNHESGAVNGNTSNGVVGHEDQAGHVNGTTPATHALPVDGESQIASPAAPEAPKDTLARNYDNGNEKGASRIREVVDHDNSTQNSTVFVPLSNGSSPSQDHHEDHPVHATLSDEGTQHIIPTSHDVTRVLDHHVHRAEAGSAGLSAVGKTDDVLPTNMNTDVNGNVNGSAAYAGFRAVNEVVGGWRAA